MIQTKTSTNNDNFSTIPDNIHNHEGIFDTSHITKDTPTSSTVIHFKNNKTEKCISKLSSNILDLNCVTNKKNEVSQTNTGTNNDNYFKNYKTEKYISKLSSNILDSSSVTIIRMR